MNISDILRDFLNRRLAYCGSTGQWNNTTHKSGQNLEFLAEYSNKVFRFWKTGRAKATSWYEVFRHKLWSVTKAYITFQSSQLHCGQLVATYCCIWFYAGHSLPISYKSHIYNTTLRIPSGATIIYYYFLKHYMFLSRRLSPGVYIT
jgi:hypothetical protein